MSFSYLYPSHIRVVGVQGNNDLSLSLSLSFFLPFAYLHNGEQRKTINKRRKNQ